MASPLIYFMTTDSPIVAGMGGDGQLLSFGYSDCWVDVLVSLPQENWVFKASYYLVAFSKELGLTSMHRTNTMIATLMLYVVGSGMMTR